MASFNTLYIDDIIDSFEKLANTPEETINEMLIASGDVLVKEQKLTAEAKGLQHTGKMISSIDRDNKVREERGGTAKIITVYPRGTHHIYKARKGGNKVARNADVAFVQNYGAPLKNIKATHFIDEANEKAEPEIYKTQEEIYNKKIDELF